jgi:hypothetical protein
VVYTPNVVLVVVCVGMFVSWLKFRMFEQGLFNCGVLCRRCVVKSPVCVAVDCVGRRFQALALLL